MFTFLVTLGWVLIIIGAIVQIFVAILNLLVIQQVALPTIFNSINDIFQTSIFKQEEILNGLTGDVWAYTINALSIFVALAAIILVSFQINRVKKGQRIARPYIKMIFVTLMIASLVYGKVAVLILATFIFIGLLFIESSLFDVEALQNFVEERNMIVIYHQDKKLEREVNKEGKYHGSATMGVGVTTAGIEDTEKNFKDNDYVNADDNKKSFTQKSNAMFTSNELNKLFNSDKNDVDENELANLISDMTHAVSIPANSELTKPHDLTKPPLRVDIAKNTITNTTEEEESSVKAAANAESETSSLESDVINVSIKENSSNADYAVNADVELFVDKTSALQETDVLNDEEKKEEPTLNKEIDFDFLNDDVLDSSSSDARVLTKKEKKLYNKWSEMYQQALNIKNLIEEEVQTTNTPNKSIKKKAKIYNSIAKEANGLVAKLKLGANQHLAMMHIAEIFGDNSQPTADFLNENVIVSSDDVLDDISNETISIKEETDAFDSLTKIDDLSINDLNVVSNETITVEDNSAAPIIETIVPTEVVKESPQEDLTFIPKDYNIDKLGGELLPEIQSSHSQTTETVNYVDDSHGYTFAELEGLDDIHQEVDLVATEDKTSDAEIVSFENNDQIEAILEETEMINNDLSSEQSEPISTSAEKVTSFSAITEDNKIATLSTEPPLVKNLEHISDENDMVDKEDNKGELLEDVVVSEPIKSKPLEIIPTPPEIKPALDDEISYSLDELDNKIMNGDFSNLTDEVVEYETEEKDTPVVETTPVKQEPVSEQMMTSPQPASDSNVECRFEKLEELIKNSIDLQSAHKKTLGEVQEYLTNLTLKVETLETKSTDFAKKIADVETKKYVNYHGVVPIDQFYPQIDDLNLASTRYNLYNKKGYSNTYGATSASDVPYGSGSYYRAKNPLSGQDEMMISNPQHVDYNHLNLHSISKYTKQDIPYESNCPFCKKNSK